MPIFGDHVDIPIADGVDETIGRRVTRIVKEKAVGLLNIGDMNHVSQSTNDSDWGRYLIDVMMPKDW